MSQAYEEVLQGAATSRAQPGARHEAICGRLHARVGECLKTVTVATLLPRRTLVQMAHHTLVRPDLAVITAATGKLWLAAEIVSSEDHHPDTVTKKTIYEELRLPRLWMVDPRYDNVEVYHGGPYGLTLKEILAVRDVLSEPLLPSFQYIISELFKP